MGHDAGAALAYSTSTGEQPRSHLARLAVERELGSNQPTPLIRRTTTANHPWASRQRASDLDYHVQACDELMKAVRRNRREGQRLVVISSTEAYLVNL